MRNRSALISEDARSRSGRECGYYSAFAAALCLSGLSMLLVPIVHGKAVFAFAASWLLFISLILSLLRPVLFSRGVADAVMGIITGLFYGVCGWAAGSNVLADIVYYRMLLCVLLMFAGISRLLVFARMLFSVSLPMLALSCGADFVAALVTLLAFSSDSANLYWVTGMVLLFDAVESVAAAVRVAAESDRRPSGQTRTV